MANSWFRLYAEFAHDAKVQMMSECDQRRLVMLFCIRCNGDVTLQDEEVAFQLRISNEEWQVTKANFVSKGFINPDNEVLNWDKRQFVSDTSAARVAKHREKKKQECNVTVTASDTDTDTDTDKKQKKKTYTPPIDGELLSSWMEVRKAKRAGKVTELAFNAVVREAAIAGITVEQAIQVCCERGWQSFNAGWYSGSSGKSSGNKQEALEQKNSAATTGWKPPELRRGVVL